MHSGGLSLHCNYISSNEMFVTPLTQDADFTLIRPVSKCSSKHVMLSPSEDFSFMIVPVFETLESVFVAFSFMCLLC